MKDLKAHVYVCKHVHTVCVRVLSQVSMRDQRKPSSDKSHPSFPFQHLLRQLKRDLFS